MVVGRRLTGSSQLGLESGRLGGPAGTSGVRAGPEPRARLIVAGSSVLQPDLSLHSDVACSLHSDMACFPGSLRAVG